MSVKIDIAASEQARAEGNAAFKRGKWVESIGHYTSAIIHNPSDPVGYCNRAQAYLKLDKFQDAERDCTTTLNLQKGNVKALYRRALARKGLNKFDQAIQDLNELLKLEPKNGVAISELEDLEAEKVKAVKPVKPRIPPSPPKLPTKNLPPTAEETTFSQKSVSKPPDNLVSDSNPPSSSSFASLRKTRDGKKTFINPNGNYEPALSLSKSPDPTSNKSLNTGTSSSIPSTTISPSPIELPVNNSRQSQNPAPTKQTSPKTSIPHRPPSPPPNPESTSPGAGITLIRKLNECTTPSEAFILLSYYSPKVISKILENLLEPDILGLILLSLSDAVQRNPTEEVVQRVKEVMEGLKSTGRYRMNRAMLARDEREAGDRAWKLCGGQGDWV